jgi:hypothetical protein
MGLINIDSSGTIDLKRGGEGRGLRGNVIVNLLLVILNLKRNDTTWLLLHHSATAWRQCIDLQSLALC